MSVQVTSIGAQPHTVEGAQHGTLFIGELSLLSRHSLIVSSPRRKEVYICTLKVHSSKFSAGNLKKGETLYTISALYINISGLGVRECSRIFLRVAQMSPALVAFPARVEGRARQVRVAAALRGGRGGQRRSRGRAGRQGRWVRSRLMVRVRVRVRLVVRQARVEACEGLGGQAGPGYGGQAGSGRAMALEAA